MLIRFIFLLFFSYVTFLTKTQVVTILDDYLTIVKSDAELYSMHKSAMSYAYKTQGYGIASVIFLVLASFGAITVSPNGAADPLTGSLVLLSLGIILGSITGLVAIGSYGKLKS